MVKLSSETVSSGMTVFTPNTLHWLPWDELLAQEFQQQPISTKSKHHRWN